MLFITIKWFYWCLPMVRETWVQSQVTSYQRLYQWYLIPPCWTLSNIRYVSRVKWSNPRKGVAPSPIPRCRNYWKGSLPVILDYSCQLTYYWPYLGFSDTFLYGLFNAKAILLEQQQWCYLTHSWGDKGVHTFLKGIWKWT